VGGGSSYWGPDRCEATRQQPRGDAGRSDNFTCLKPDVMCQEKTIVT
jgi:hypothetical protein